MYSGGEWAALDFEPVYRGHGGIRRMLERLNEGFASSRWEPREVIDAGGGNFVCRMVLVGVGLVTGLAGSLATAGVLRSLLFETDVYDPFTFAIVPLLLAAVSFAACYIPARRRRASTRW